MIPLLNKLNTKLIPTTFLRGGGGSICVAKNNCYTTISTLLTKSTTTTTTTKKAAANSNINTQWDSFRSLTTPTNNLVITDMDPSNGIATITMNSGPVNSLSLELCQSIRDSILEIEAVPEIQGLIVQSNVKNVGGTFCAGLDLKELYQPDSNRLIEFWSSFQNVFRTLYGSRLACIAALDGHAIAGGCMIALACDYRIMPSTATDTTTVTKPVTIGMNETKLGIVAPPWMGKLMIDTIGVRSAEKALQFGTLFTPEEALKIGMIDELVPLDTVRDRATIIAKTLGKIPSKARVMSKLLIRQERIDTLTNNVQQDIDHFVQLITEVETQKKLGMYVAMLAKSKSSSK